MLKLGGELLEQPQRSRARRARHRRARTNARRSSSCTAAARRSTRRWRAAGIPKQQVDGLRVTDARTLDVVVAVLAGAINTRLVAAVRRAGGRAGRPHRRRRVGRDREAGGADRQRRRATRSTSGSSARRSTTARRSCSTDLLARGYVPVVACIGATRDGQLLNVNADTLAVASRRGARRAAAGHRRRHVGRARRAGQTIARLTARDAARLIKAGHGEQGHGGEAAGVPRRAPATASATC